MFSIDDERTVFFDDAFSLNEIEPAKPGMPAIYLVEIHISDVARLLKKDTQMDKEAHDRRESKYFKAIRQQIPMLPIEFIEVCSLSKSSKR